MHVGSGEYAYSSSPDHASVSVGQLEHQFVDGGGDGIEFQLLTLNGLLVPGLILINDSRCELPS
jgi:hypothetical protein